MELNKIINGDCLDILKTIPDNYFELAIVDPPYGGGAKSQDETFPRTNGRFGNKNSVFEKYNTMRNDLDINCDRTGGGWASKYGSNIKDWDVAPPKEYFDELFRVSKNQIIWGGNYFSLPPTRCFLIWKKLTISENFTMAMCEYAWTSFNSNAKIFECAPQDKARFHPTQKPVALYEWVISKYAQDGDKILDTHAGSGSCCVASYNTGHDFLGIEIDPFYCKKATERLEDVMAQQKLF